MAEWVSSRAPLQWPKVSPIRILGADMALLVRPCCGGVPHGTEAPTARIYNYELYVLGGFGEKKKEKRKKNDWQQLLAQLPIFKINLSAFLLLSCLCIIFRPSQEP